MEQPGYETRGGGYGDVRVCILDPGTMRSKRVAVKTVRVKEHHKEQLRLVFVRHTNPLISIKFTDPHSDSLAVSSRAESVGETPPSTCLARAGLLPPQT